MARKANPETFTSTTTSVKVIVGDEEFEYGELTLNNLKALARDANIASFNAFLVTEDGEKPLKSSDFPITNGVVKVVPVNKAGTY